VAFTAFLDASVLFPIGLCDSLLWIAALDLYSPRWSADVLVELRRNILKEDPDMDPGEIDQRIADMRHAFLRPKLPVTRGSSLQCRLTTRTSMS
jgi:hypothetical protein